jgi:hypothetical protein
VICKNPQLHARKICISYDLILEKFKLEKKLLEPIGRYHRTHATSLFTNGFQPGILVITLDFKSMGGGGDAKRETYMGADTCALNHFMTG